MASSSATICEARPYVVFLSFRGEDTRNGFTSHLHQALSDSQISTFIDNNLERGDDISPSLLTTIEESMISVIIFSENYANSKWCLKELVKILQCRELNGQIVIPVFYGVDPSDVKKQSGNFGVAFKKLKKRLRKGEMDLNEVRSHLEEAANISGWSSHDIRPETELIRSIVGDILKKVEVLDLSLCDQIEELPRSISDLVNLTALLLCGCKSLIHVPSLAKLEKLKKLDLRDCVRLKQMPEGVRFLLNLKDLDLSGSGIEEIGSGIIPMLSRLQVLKLCNENGRSKFSIRGSEVGELRRLETLHCRFSNAREFGEYMKSRERSQQSPSDYSIFITREYSYWPTFSRKFVSVTGDNFIDPLALPTDIEALNITRCYSTLYKRMFPPSLLASLLNLQEILVYDWGAIEEIFAMNEGENGERFPFSNYSTRSLSNHSLLNLERIEICACDKLKKLFPPGLLPNLPNLQQIWVSNSYGMEEIFSTDREEEDNHDLPNLTGLHLSRLTTLNLRNLSELRSIYKGAIICQSLQQIELVKCPKLKRITLPVPQPSLERIEVYPKEWWESVQWGSANDKIHLQSLAGFSISSYV